VKNLAMIFKTLSDESRLRIYTVLLASGELCVCDIEGTLRFTQTKVSRHLAYLKRAGLVKDRKQGLWMLYSITEPKHEEQKQLLRAIVEGLKSNPLAQRDAKLLAQSIKRGSCTTFAVLKPRVISMDAKAVSPS
jgi:ArsR family transcriptional regulator, arsenate/arsenite/antimonite-responsive transcriptional repressor